MRKYFEFIKLDKIAKWTISLSAIIILIELAFVGLLYNRLPPLMPIFNQLPWGEQRLGSKIEIFIPIGIILLYFTINFLLTAKFHEKLPLLSRMLSITTFLISILSLFFIFRTLQLII